VTSLCVTSARLSVPVGDSAAEDERDSSLSSFDTMGELVGLFETDIPFLTLMSVVS